MVDDLRTREIEGEGIPYVWGGRESPVVEDTMISGITSPVTHK